MITEYAGLRIAEPGHSPYDHRFGGESWTVVSSEEPTTPCLIASLDLRDPQLGELAIRSTVPLFSRMDGPPEPDFYRFDEGRRTVTYLDAGVDSPEASELEPVVCSLEEVSLRIRFPRRDENSSNRDIAEDTLYGGSGFFRLGGPGLWVYEAPDINCVCGRDLCLLATIGYQGSRCEQGLLNGEPFFVGEMALYFAVCQVCPVVAAMAQG